MLFFQRSPAWGLVNQAIEGKEEREEERAFVYAHKRAATTAIHSRNLEGTLFNLVRVERAGLLPKTNLFEPLWVPKRTIARYGS